MRLIALTLLMVVTSLAHAIPGLTIPAQHVQGYVLGRGLVYINQDTKEGLYLVEYNDQGEEVNLVEELPQGLGDTFIFSRERFNLDIERVGEFLSRYPETLARGATVISAEAFEQGAYPEGAETLSGRSISPKTLQTCGYPEANSVLVKEKRQRFNDDACELILLTMSVDLSVHQDPLPPEVESVWMDENGRIKYQSPNRIGFRQGFYGQNGEPENLSAGGTLYSVDPAETDFYAPFPFTSVSAAVALGGLDVGVGLTNDKGRYAGTYLTTPCPGFSYSIKNQLTAQVPYINELPTGAPVFRLYLPRTVYDSCANVAAGICGTATTLGATAACSSAIAIEATRAIIPTRVNFIVDLIVLQGFSYLENENGIVELADETTWYEPQDELKKRLQTHFDLDGDREEDRSKPGVLKPISEVFPDEEHDDPDMLAFEEVSDVEEATHQGIYLSSLQEPEDNQPHFLKLIDHVREGLEEEQGVGLVKTISEADLGNTDIYVFRESNGELILQRRGVRDSEYTGDNNNSNQVDTDDSAFRYQIRLRGNRSSRFDAGDGSFFSDNNLGPDGEYARWAERSQLEPNLHQRNSDFLKPGEVIRIVAINRSTGYVGTQRHTLGSGEEALRPIRQPLVMRPPNVRVWAEREYKVEKGATKDEEREYIIGQEGAGTIEDTQIVVYTEWLDHDGSPLPKELGRNDGKDFGLTGRLQQVVGPNKLSQPAGETNEFGIQPGKHTQVIELPGSGRLPGHFYVHVIGTGLNQECLEASQNVNCATFEEEQAHPVFTGRPYYAAPIRVPVFDEDTHLETLLVFNQERDRLIELQTENNPTPGGIDPSELIKPQTQYAWVHRPEYAFSLVELDVKNIQREYKDENNRIQTVDILDQTPPIIASGDELVRLLYSGNTGNDNTLDPIDSAQDPNDRYLWSLGEAEAAVTFDDEEHTIEFEDLENLSLLEVDDILTLRLLSNVDTQNILYEWAFEFFGITLISEVETRTDDMVFLRTDKTEVQIQAALLGYALRDEEDREPVTVTWDIEDEEGDGGRIGISRETNEVDAIFDNRLFMGETVGSKGRVVAYYETEEGERYKAISPLFIVISGEPHSVVVENQEGSAATREQGTLEYTFKVLDDRFQVVGDRYSISFSIDGDAHVVEADDYIVNGLASVSIKGGITPSPSNTLTVAVGKVSQTFDFSVSPINIEWSTTEAEVEVDGTANLVAQLTGPDGAPASDVPVEVGVSRGAVNAPSWRTDANGMLNLSYMAPPRVGVADIRVTGDLESSITHTIQIIPMVDEAAAAAMGDNVPLVGSESVDGAMSVSSVDQQSYSISYQTRYLLPVVPNETVTVGTASYPNHVPLIDMPMNQFSPEVNRGAVTAQIDADGVLRDTSSPNNYGGSAYFNGNGRITLNYKRDLRLLQPGWSLAFKPDTTGQTGTLIRHGGVFTLKYQAGELVLEARTSEGTHTVRSGPVAADQWHQVGVFYNEQVLHLDVNNQIFELPLTEALQYGQFASDIFIAIGDGYNGALKNARLFDYQSAPLLALQGNTQQLVATEDTVNVQSTGNLPQDIQTMVVVAIREENGQMNQVNLMSSERFSELGGAMATQAEGNIDWEDFSDTFIDTRAAENPNNLLRSLSQELGANGANSIKYLISMLDSLEESEPLKPHLQDFYAFLMVPEHKNFADQIQYELMEAVEDAISGDPLKLSDMILPLKVFSEVVDDHYTAASDIAMSVDSGNDLEEWFNFMGLPARGWLSAIPPWPDVDSECDDQVPDINVGTPLEFSSIPCRVKGGDIAAFVESVLSGNGDIMDTNPEVLAEIPRMMNSTVETAPLTFRLNLFAPGNTQIGQVTGGNVAHAIFPLIAKILKGSAELVVDGLRNLKAFVSGNSNTRVDPLTFLGLAGYLTTRTSDDCEDDPGCESLEDVENVEQISSKINTALGRIAFQGELVELSGKENQGLACSLYGATHGDIFEIVAIAYHHMKYEFGGKNPKEKIVAIERRELIHSVARDGDEYKLSTTKKNPHERFVDIVLEGDGELARTWIELKSIAQGARAGGTGNEQKRLGVALSKWPIWRYNTKPRSTRHKQLFLDYASLSEPISGLTLIEGIENQDRQRIPVPYQRASKIQWYLQSWILRDFKLKNGKSIFNGLSYAERTNEQTGGVTRDFAFLALRDHFSTVPSFQGRSGGVPYITLGQESKEKAIDFLKDNIVGPGSRSRRRNFELNEGDFQDFYLRDRFITLFGNNFLAERLALPPEYQRALDFLNSPEAQTVINTAEELQERWDSFIDSANELLDRIPYKKELEREAGEAIERLREEANKKLDELTADLSEGLDLQQDCE